MRFLVCVLRPTNLESAERTLIREESAMSSFATILKYVSWVGLFSVCTVGAYYYDRRFTMLLVPPFVFSWVRFCSVFLKPRSLRFAITRVLTRIVLRAQLLARRPFNPMAPSSIRCCRCQRL